MPIVYQSSVQNGETLLIKSRKWIKRVAKKSKEHPKFRKWVNGMSKMQKVNESSVEDASMNELSVENAKSKWVEIRKWTNRVLKSESIIFKNTKNFYQSWVES